MPLMLHIPPATAPRLFEDALVDLRSSGLLALPASARPEFAAPLRVFVLDATSLAEGRGLSAARPIGWWSELRNEGLVVGALEMADVPSPRRGQSALRFGAFFTGALQRGLTEVLQRSAREAGRRRVTASILRAPGVHFTALWLQPSTGDVLVPVAPTNAAFEDRARVAADVALAALVPAAQAALNARP